MTDQEPRYKTTVTVCAHCGQPYSNLYAHIEACRGFQAVPRQVELTEQQLEHFRRIHDRPNR